MRTMSLTVHKYGLSALWRPHTESLSLKYIRLYSRLHLSQPRTLTEVIMNGNRIIFRNFWLICGLLYFGASACVSDNGGNLHYDSSTLLAIRQLSIPYINNQLDLEIPFEMRRPRPKKRGQKGGIRMRMGRRKLRTPVPSVITGNTRSIRNKVDELEALAKYDYRFRDSAIMCFTETWLSVVDTDDSVSISGFNVVQADRTAAANKSKGGGVCVYINEKYCTNYCVKHQYCDSNIELLAVGLRPFYLPREFIQVITVVTYIPPSAKYNEASEKLEDLVSSLENNSPDSLIIITGDFNRCPRDALLSNYEGSCLVER